MLACLVDTSYNQIDEEEEHAHGYCGGGLAGAFEADYGNGGYGGGRSEEEYDRDTVTSEFTKKYTHISQIAGVHKGRVTRRRVL